MRWNKCLWPASIIVPLLGSLLLLYFSGAPINILVVIYWAFMFHIVFWVGHALVVKIIKCFRDKNEKEKE